MKKIIIQDGVIATNILLSCFNTQVDYLVVGKKQYCDEVGKEAVVLRFYLNTKGSLDYEFGRRAIADIAFTKKAIEKYAKAYIARRGQQLYAETVRLASTKKPSVAHKFYSYKYYDTDEMTVSIPYSTIGTELCKSLELWTSDSMRVHLDKENENLEIVQTLRIADMDDDLYLLDVDAELIDDGKKNYDAINECIKNADTELPF